MSVQKLKAHLAAKSENELIKEITILYQQFSVVKDFYTVQMSADGEREVFTKHKKIIQEQFFPQRGLGKKLRLSVGTLKNGRRQRRLWSRRQVCLPINWPMHIRT